MFSCSLVCSVHNFDSDTGNLETVKALVAAGADVSLAADGGVTPLHAAAELGGIDLVKLLLKVLPIGSAALCLPCPLPLASACPIPVLCLPFNCQVFPCMCILSVHFGTYSSKILPVSSYFLCLPDTTKGAFPGQLRCPSLRHLPFQVVLLCSLMLGHWRGVAFTAPILQKGALVTITLLAVDLLRTRHVAIGQSQRLPRICDHIPLRGFATPVTF